MKKLYIVRKFVNIEGGAKHFYEEEIFDTYQLAFNFMKRISDEDEDIFLSEIVTFYINNKHYDEEKETQIFNRQGNLIFEQKNDEQINIVNTFTGKFSIGDIVRLPPFPWNNFSPTCIETIGVVSKTPISIEEWQASEKDIASWDDNYIVEYIRDGYLGHWHVKEDGIEFYKKELPDNLLFLNKLSQHYLNIELLPAEILKKIHNGNIFIEKINHFNFEER